MEFSPAFQTALNKEMKRVESERDRLDALSSESYEAFEEADNLFFQLKAFVDGESIL